MKWVLKLLGIPHHDWEYTHRTHSEKRCRVCGERRSEYIMWVTGPMPTWWETSGSGDGSCGNIPELPIRIY